MYSLISHAEDFSAFAFLLIYVYLSVVMIFIIMENRDTSSTLAWILIFLLFPVIGLFLYIFFGRNWKVHNPQKKNRIKELRERSEKFLKRIRARQNEYFKSVKECGFSVDIERMLQISQNNSDALLTVNNAITIFQSGKEKFDALKNDLQNAQKFIHMEYFIWHKDPLTQEISDILIAKAKEGVEVRIIFDPIGSFFTNFFQRGHFRRMRKAGVRVVPFYNTLSPLKITTINYFLHRKIVVIDGVIGYTGGMNMGQEYITGGKRYSSWRDTHMRIYGEAVLSLQATFAINWEEAQKESIFKEKYFPLYIGRVYGDLPIQIISSEPHSYWQPIKQSLFAMILSAQDHVYIQTPYFIPDDNLFEAMKIVALSGADVRLMITGVVDKSIPYWAAFTYFEELLLAGVKIYHYNAGFLHAKTIMVDSCVCSIGTTNMDIRSLRLSYENNVVIFDRDVTQKMERDFKDDLIKCSRFTFGDHKKKNFFIRLRNSIVRLLSPLL
jgi:cardiolipin synthase